MVKASLSSGTNGSPDKPMRDLGLVFKDDAREAGGAPPAATALLRQVVSLRAAVWEETGYRRGGPGTRGGSKSVKLARASQ